MFSLSVTTTLEVSQQQVMDALASAGIPAADLVQVYADPNVSAVTSPSGLVYGFTYTAPIGKMNESVRRLNALSRALPDGLLYLNFSASAGISEAAADNARRRVIPQLIAEAGQKAEFLANAAGLKLGGVQAVSESGTLSFPSAVIPASRVPAISASSLRTTFSIFVQFSVSGN